MNTAANWTPLVGKAAKVGLAAATDATMFNPKYVDIWTYASVFPATIDREYTPDLGNVGEGAITHT